jgi:hypothetical protein
MASPRLFRPVDLGCEADDLGVFSVATINWTQPEEWDEQGHPPLQAAERQDALYVLVREHGRSAQKNIIRYVGMTTALSARFNNHDCANELRAKRGQTLLSVGNVTFSGSKPRWSSSNAKLALRQIEHILIWALPPPLLNKQGQYVLPLLSGRNIAQAKPWIIKNTGHRFHGRMPLEIVFPWLLIKHGRDRSLRKKAS